MKWLSHFKIMVTFAAHIISATVVFCIIGSGAWCLHLARDFLQTKGLEDIVLAGLHGIEILLFACDAAATAFWSIMSTLKAIKEIKEL